MTADGEQAARGEERAVRAEVRAHVERAWDPTLPLEAWRQRLFESGWACPGWPTRWGGRGLTPALAAAANDELSDAGVPGPPDGVAMLLAAPTLLEHASAALCSRFLEPIATGRETWCQLFSEPGAGSDLAGLTTRASLDGEEWVISGQKVWNTGAATADFGLLVARSDWDVPKHAGITYFVLPMRQPGIEVRPLVQMNGHRSFNEVFLDGARVPDGLVVGAPGEGWRVALATLAHERRLATSRAQPHRRDPGGRVWTEAVAERVAAAEPHRWYPQRAGRVDLLVPLARAAGRSDDPLVRQSIAGVVTRAQAARWTAQRAAAQRALGRPPGPEGSIGKLATSDIARAAAAAHTMITGIAATARGGSDDEVGVVAEILVSVPAQSIAGGTDEIQRSILAERMLGLPKEPDPGRDLPFRDLPRNG